MFVAAVPLLLRCSFATTASATATAAVDALLLLLLSGMVSLFAATVLVVAASAAEVTARAFHWWRSLRSDVKTSVPTPKVISPDCR